MLKKFLVIVLILVAVIVLVLFYFYSKQESIIFHPTRTYHKPLPFLEIEEIFINTADGEKLHAWWRGTEEGEDTIIFLHGNAGNLSHRVERVRLFERMGYNSFLIDYRGYGKSSGKIKSENDIYVDAEAAYNYVLRERGIPEENIILWGRSLGGAPAIDLAQNKKIKALVCESTFFSAVDLGETLFPYLPVDRLLKYRFENNKKIKKVTAPILIIHGEEDEVIPYQQGRRLYQAAPEPKSFIKIKKGRHNTSKLGEYKDQIKDFLENN